MPEPAFVDGILDPEEEICMNKQKLRDAQHYLVWCVVNDGT
jgi:hypothetical protein